MLREAISLLSTSPRRAIITHPPEMPPHPFPGLKAFACDHPYPSERNVRAAEAVHDFVAESRPDETLIALISGGASAHLSLPAWGSGLTIDDLREVTRLLQLGGANIRELNAVRKHVEALKGGRLAALSPAPVETFILSDVLNDRLDVISSGPFAPDTSTYADALAVLDRFSMPGQVPSIRAYLSRGVRGEVPETPKEGEPSFGRVANRIISSNRNVVEAVRDHLSSQGVHIAGVEHAVEGEASFIGGRIGALARSVRCHRPWAYIVGGEWTVTVGESGGKGGPSQELALAAARELSEGSPATLLAYSTDGVDGPTDAAGGFVTSRTWSLVLDADKMLADHNAYEALKGAKALIPGGPTGTNLNHVAVLLCP